MNFVSLDFETANDKKGSACSIGMALHDEDGTVLDTYYSLMCPYEKFFDGAMTQIHGLNPRDCIAAPTFKEQEKDIISFIGDHLVVAHFAAFDIGVLKGCYEVYNLQMPSFYYADSIRAAHMIDMKFENYKLTTLSKALNLNYNAHVAIDDAINCGKIFAMGCQGHLSNFQEFQEFCKKNKIYVKQI
jgi:DNA polymerase-3 subunit epsilon